MTVEKKGGTDNSLAAKNHGSRILALASLLSAVAIFLVLVAIPKFDFENDKTIMFGWLNDPVGQKVLLHFSFPVIVCGIGALVLRIKDDFIRVASVWSVLLFLLFILISMLNFGLIYMASFLLLLFAAIGDTVLSVRNSV